MDKYLVIIMCFMLIGIPVSFVAPDGSMREPPFYTLFYASIGGAVIIIIYSSWKTRKAQQEIRRERRRKFKK